MLKYIHKSENNYDEPMLIFKQGVCTPCKLCDKTFLLLIIHCYFNYEYHSRMRPVL